MSIFKEPLIHLFIMMGSDKLVTTMLACLLRLCQYLELSTLKFKLICVSPRPRLRLPLAH